MNINNIIYKLRKNQFQRKKIIKNIYILKKYYLFFI